jgi:hypothetical protein
MFMKPPSCITHETHSAPIEYRNKLTHNTIQKHQKTSPTTPPPGPAPLPHTTKHEHPAGTQNAGTPHTPNNHPRRMASPQFKP